VRCAVPALFVALFIPARASAAELVVSNVNDLVSAFGAAVAGDVIRIMPGTYRLNAALWTGNDGTPTNPILVTTDRVGDARLDFVNIEGVVINNPDWVLERIWINGACASAPDCESGLGVKPRASRFVLRESRITNWTQHVKGSRTPTQEVEDCVIMNSEFYDTSLRVPSGTTPIDIVGGKRWHIFGNYIHDYGGDDNGDYGIFLKGATSDGIVEQNLVICEKDFAGGGATVGISVGGGGTGAEFCPNNDCSCEDRNSIVRNNIVLHCNDTGLHSRRGCGSKFYNNIVFDTVLGLQIQVNGPDEPIQIRNNVMTAGIEGQNNYVAANNMINVPREVFTAAYADPDNANFMDGTDTTMLRDLGEDLPEVTADYCGRTRSGYDFGAIEFPAACSTWPWTGASTMMFPPSDGGVVMRQDAGMMPPPMDGGFTIDAGFVDVGTPPQNDASVEPAEDAAPGADRRSGGSVRSSVGGSCACSAHYAGGSSSWWWPALLLGLVSRLFVRPRERVSTSAPRRDI
jgi:hypothetical protein